MVVCSGEKYHCNKVMSWHEGHLVIHGMKVRMQKQKGHEAEQVAATSLVCCDWCKGARDATVLVFRDWCKSEESHATGFVRFDWCGSKEIARNWSCLI